MALRVVGERTHLKIGEVMEPKIYSATWGPRWRYPKDVRAEPGLWRLWIRQGLAEWGLLFLGRGWIWRRWRRR
jgi:hypothetical protein